MNKLDQTYKELSIPYFGEVFKHIDEVLVSMGIPYYLIGVTSLALQLLREGVRPGRGTKDIDFAIMIGSMAEYETVVTALEKRGFIKVKIPWTLYHREYNTAIDLLPFGTIEENDTVNFTERKIDLHVLGFSEVLEDSIPLKLDERLANVPPLHGLVILKLIAWNDRPEERGNDPYDILSIIDNYFLFEQGKIIEDHYDIFPDGDDDVFDRKMISARVIGRQMASILKKSDTVKDRVLHILDKIISTESENNSFLYGWAYSTGSSMEYGVDLLKAMRQGVQEKLATE